MINVTIFRFILSSFLVKEIMFHGVLFLIIRYFRIISDIGGFADRLRNIVDKYVNLGFKKELQAFAVKFYVKSRSNFDSSSRLKCSFLGP